jgi:signal transduction histidine kinase
MEKVFQRFYQSANDFLTDKPRGSGLGLAICHEIVQHYGGSMHVESEPGRGATFVVSLPAGPLAANQNQNTG